MDSDTRRNLVTYYLNFVVSAVVGFIVNPLLLGALGPLLFGVWKSLQRYLDFATVADGRASQALKWIVANRSSSDRRRAAPRRRRRHHRVGPLASRGTAGLGRIDVRRATSRPRDARRRRLGGVYRSAILAANTVLFGLLSIPTRCSSGSIRAIGRCSSPPRHSSSATPSWSAPRSPVGPCGRWPSSYSASGSATRH